nr:kinesin-like protein KIF11-B [Megalopta genalis]
MMENVTSEFNLLEKDKNEHFSMVTSKCNYVCDVCDQANDHSTDTCSNNIKLENTLREQVQTHLEEIAYNVITVIEKNETLVNATVTEGKNLVNELQSNINASSDVLKQYKNLIECNEEELQQEMDDDKNKALGLLDDAFKIFDNANKNYESVIKNEENELINTYEKISSISENLITESTECCNENIEQLHVAVREVNQFFDDEIQHDVPTGTTPARKEFSYPRQFTVTSPHERILKKFRETRKLVETSEDYNDLDGEITLKQIANSTSISNVTMISSTLDNTRYSTSSTNSELLSKHSNSCNSLDSNEHFTSTLNMSEVLVQSKSLDYLQSEDKENRSCNSLPCKKIKDTEPLKLKKIN